MMGDKTTIGDDRGSSHDKRDWTFATAEVLAPEDFLLSTW